MTEDIAKFSEKYLLKIETYPNPLVLDLIDERETNEPTKTFQTVQFSLSFLGRPNISITFFLKQ